MNYMFLRGGFKSKIQIFAAFSKKSHHCMVSEKIKSIKKFFLAKSIHHSKKSDLAARPNRKIF